MAVWHMVQGVWVTQREVSTHCNTKLCGRLWSPEPGFLACPVGWASSRDLSLLIFFLTTFLEQNGAWPGHKGTLILLSPMETLSLSAVLFLPPSCHLCTKKSGFALTLPSVLSSSERRRAVYVDPACLLPFHCFSRRLTEGQAVAADGFGKLLGKCLHLGPLPHLRMPWTLS